MRPLTPERRLIVSAEALKSPLGTAAPTLQFHFQGGRRQQRKSQVAQAAENGGACSELRGRIEVVRCMVYLVSRSSTDS